MEKNCNIRKKAIYADRLEHLGMSTIWSHKGRCTQCDICCNWYFNNELIASSLPLKYPRKNHKHSPEPLKRKKVKKSIPNLHYFRFNHTFLKKG